MSSLSALSDMLKDTNTAFSGAGYSSFNIEAHIVCVIILAVLFSRQQNSSDQTEANVTWSRLLIVQILYCISGILRVLADINIIPRSNISQCIITAANFGLFGIICWLVFLYIAMCQKSQLLKSLKAKILSALPLMFNIIMLITTPFTGLFLDISGAQMKTGILFPLMVSINLAYPAAGVALAFLLRRKLTHYESDNLQLMAVYPSFFMICGPLQALNWRMPFLCYAIVISDIFVYISHADSLVSIDPLTKIPNRNALMQRLSERFRLGNNERLHLFAVDVLGLGHVNASYGRTEGDKALILVAGALKKFRDKEHECEVFRYYGDEFVVVADVEDSEERELFIEHIRNYVGNAAMSAKLPYHVKVEIGCAKYEHYSKTETIPGLIGEADRAMNEAKEQKRFRYDWRI